MPLSLQNAQPVLDCQAGCTDQEAVRELLARWVAHGVDRLPGDNHRHHRRLAGAGRKFERQPQQLGIGVFARQLKIPQQTLAVGRLGCNLDKPDRGLRRLDLTEEWADATEIVVSPVLQEPGRPWKRACPSFDGSGSV